MTTGSDADKSEAFVTDAAVLLKQIKRASRTRPCNLKLRPRVEKLIIKSIINVTTAVIT